MGLTNLNSPDNKSRVAFKSLASANNFITAGIDGPVSADSGTVFSYFSGWTAFFALLAVRRGGFVCVDSGRRVKKNIFMAIIWEHSRKRP